MRIVLLLQGAFRKFSQLLQKCRLNQPDDEHNHYKHYKLSKDKGWWFSPNRGIGLGHSNCFSLPLPIGSALRQKRALQGMESLFISPTMPCSSPYMYNARHSCSEDMKRQIEIWNMQIEIQCSIMAYSTCRTTQEVGIQSVLLTSWQFSAHMRWSET